jgi:hypothetical protein
MRERAAGRHGSTFAADPMCRSSAPASAANSGLWWIDRHTITATRPPGTSTLAISASAPDGSGKNCKRSWQQTTSKLPSENGNRPAVACTYPIGEPPTGRPRATASMPGLRSKPTTRPSAPTRPAASRATTPVPQATSNPLTRSRVRQVKEPWCPWPKDRRHQLAVIDLGGTARHLPLLVAHAASSARLLPTRAHGGQPLQTSPRKPGGPRDGCG